MNVRICHTDDLGTLSDRIPSFSPIGDVEIALDWNRGWRRPGGRSTSHDILVLFLGKTGYGKSSTINAFAGFEAVATSDIEACTRDAQCVEFLIRDGHYLSFVDMPGVGESTERDEEYLKLYGHYIAKADAVVYVVRADCRDFAVDERVFAELLSSQALRRKTIVAMNHCDKLALGGTRHHTVPSDEHLEAISAKVRAIKLALNCTTEPVPYSAATNWRLDTLGDAIVDALRHSEGLTFPHETFNFFGVDARHLD